jgi:alpha-L-fucosidase
VNTYALAKKSQPRIIINNRLDLGIGDSDQQIKSPLADYYTPEQHIGAYDDQRPWETCMTLGTQWSWKPDDRIKSAGEVVSILARTVGGDGNLLLNVGPMPDGRIEPRQAEVLRTVGVWVAKNGESIFHTRGGPWKPTKALASTRKGNSVFLHILHSRDGRVELPELPVKLTAATLLTGGTAEFSRGDGKVVVTVPEAKLDALDTVVRLDFAGSVMALPAVALQAMVKASASNIYRNETQQYGPAEAFDGDPATRWAADSGTREAWIAADFGRPRLIGRIAIRELYNRVTSFELQYRDGSAWKTIFAAQKIGDNFQRDFAPVTAQEFRLNILDATDGPSIAELELLEK